MQHFHNLTFVDGVCQQGNARLGQLLDVADGNNLMIEGAIDLTPQGQQVTRREILEQLELLHRSQHLLFDEESWRCIQAIGDPQSGVSRVTVRFMPLAGGLTNNVSWKVIQQAMVYLTLPETCH